jgi:hypothetical protein
VALGDPGILVSELVPRGEARHDLAVVPHWSDGNLDLYQGGYLINPRSRRDPLDAVRKIASCRRVLTSSLHGMITADAYGLPRKVVTTRRVDRDEGGDWKFRDYSQALGLEFKYGEWQTAPRDAVVDMQQRLIREFERCSPS